MSSGGARELFDRLYLEKAESSSKIVALQSSVALKYTWGLRPLLKINPLIPMSD